MSNAHLYNQMYSKKYVYSVYSPWPACQPTAVSRTAEHEGLDWQDEDLVNFQPRHSQHQTSDNTGSFTHCASSGCVVTVKPLYFTAIEFHNFACKYILMPLFLQSQT